MRQDSCIIDTLLSKYFVNGMDSAKEELNRVVAHDELTNTILTLLILPINKISKSNVCK